MLKRIILGLLAFVLGAVALLAIAIIAFRPGDPAPMSIDFTRHLVRLDGTAAPANAEFVGTPGAARLHVTCAQGTTPSGMWSSKNLETCWQGGRATSFCLAT